MQALLAFATFLICVVVVFTAYGAVLLVIALRDLSSRQSSSLSGITR